MTIKLKLLQLQFDMITHLKHTQLKKRNTIYQSKKQQKRAKLKSFFETNVEFGRVYFEFT